MRQLWTMAACAALLAGCSGSSTKESAAATGTVSLHNATVGEVADQVSAANTAAATFQPGEWKGTIRLLDMAMPGMDNLPPAVRERMKAQMASGREFSNCLTPEDAADARKTFGGGRQDDCTYDHFTMAGGKIDAAMTCKMGKTVRKMTMTGSYSRTDYHLVNQASGGGPAGANGPAGEMSMKMEITAHRAGDCAPGAK
ncbi:MAG: DUF3617 domain-containing protein [Sphingomonas sp.]|jgi:hypothetical protein